MDSTLAVSDSTLEVENESKNMSTKKSCFFVFSNIVEVWRTEVAISHIKAKISEIWDFSKTVAKMLFLSVSRESIGILTISRKKFSAQLLLVAEIGWF